MLKGNPPEKCKNENEMFQATFVSLVLVGMLYRSLSIVQLIKIATGCNG